MESKQEKILMLQTAIKQLIDEEKKSYKDVLVTDVDKEFDHRLLSKLLSQVEMLREDDLLQEDAKTCHENENEYENERRTKDFTEPEVVQPEKRAAINEESEEKREEEIVKELRKVKRQNLITHCLLSAMFVLTVTLQLSEVSMILKVKEGFNHPIRSIGGMLAGILKKPAGSMGNGKEDEKKHGENTVLETSVPGIIIPILPQVGLPSLDFDRE